MNKLILRKDISLLQTLKLIDEKIRIGEIPLQIDMSEVHFPLTRDVFLVIKKRFRVDQISLVLPHDYEVEMARSIGIGAELSGVRAEFDREYARKNILAHNLTRWEYFLYELRRGGEYIKFLFQRKRPKTQIHTIKKRSPNTFLIVIGLIMSLSLLVFIFYFAVSKTYVSVVPQTTVKPVSANIIFSQVVDTGSLFSERNVVRMKKIQLPVEYSMKFTMDAIDPNSATSAAGRITVYNELSAEQALKPWTRFVTEEGIVYKADGWVRVPPARTINGVSEVASIEAYVTAERYDEAGNIVGSHGNIPTDTLLTIPGLKFNRDKVYAKAKENFVGGTDSQIHMVTEDAVRKWQDTLREQLRRISRDNIQAWLDGENKNNHEDYALVMGEPLVFSGETMRITSGQKAWDPADEIEITGNVTAYALIFDREATIKYLTQIFREKLLEWTDKELAIHNDTLRLTNVISREADDLSIKATMEMNTTITYDLENSSNELTRRMKVLIAGLSRKDAIDKLISEGKVHEVKITFSPFWLTQVSSNVDNIEFIIQK